MITRNFSMKEKYTFIIKAKIIIPFDPLTVKFISLLQSFLFRVYFRVFSRFSDSLRRDKRYMDFVSYIWHLPNSVTNLHYACRQRCMPTAYRGSQIRCVENATLGCRVGKSTLKAKFFFVHREVACILGYQMSRPWTSHHMTNSLAEWPGFAREFFFTLR